MTDTAVKRFAALDFGADGLPFPDDNDADTELQRAHLLGLYFLGDAPEPEAGGSVYTGMVLNVARLMTR